MFLLPSLRPRTLEEIARQPDGIERLAKREAEQITKVGSLIAWQCESRPLTRP